MQKTGIEGYQRTPGNRGAWLLWRVEGDHAEFITVSFWESRAAIEAFAGQDIEKAVFYPDDEQFLIERDLRRPALGLPNRRQARHDSAWPASPQVIGLVR